MRRSRVSTTGEAGVVTKGLLWVAALLYTAPLLVVVANSFKPNADIVRDPVAWPSSFYADNYVRAWTDASLSTYIWNSVIVTTGALALCVITALPLSFALGRWSFRGRAVLFVLFLAGLMVPLKIGIVPLVQLLQAVQLLDSRLGLVVVYAAQALPMSVLILTAFFAKLPDSLEEAAVMDGAGPGTIFLRIMAPLVTPALVTVVILNLGPIWNDLFMPLVLLRDPTGYTLPVGVSTFFTEHSVDRGMLFAGVVIAILPLAVFFGFAMKYVTRGLTAGMEK